MKNLPIKKWAEEDRPREKLLQKGVSALSNTELIAILIGSGNQTESAVQLSQKILHKVNNNLHALGKLSVKELTSQFKGVGIVKAITIIAALELGKRRNKSKLLQEDYIRSSFDAFQFIRPLLCDLPHEELWISLMNRSNKVIDKIKISQGGIGETPVDLRLILKAAINSLASGIILYHNHPSGSVSPSTPDDKLTQRLEKAVKLVDIALLDHIIIADNSYYSYADEGKLSY